MKKIGLLLIAATFLGQAMQAQSDTASVKPAQKWLKKNERYMPEIKAMMQLWGIYSTGMEVFDAASGRYRPVDDRFNVSFRRARLVATGTPYPHLSYWVALFYDQAGRDLLSAGVGSTNKADPTVGIADAFVHWKISKNESLNLVGGWFRPQMQRESITSAWASTSFEKAMSQNYVRNYLVGTGPGRAAGLNIGGLLTKNKVSLSYHLGIFNPVTAALGGTSAGEKYAPLLAGRASLSLGEPEFKKYGISYDINFFNKRKGISLDFNAEQQGETDQFLSSLAYGPGVLLNWGPLNLDGEWIWMERDGTDSLRHFTAKSATGHLRLGVNIPTGRFVLEPLVMVMKFKGEMGASGQTDAATVKMSAGEETTFDAGVNWYLDGKNLKLALHYTWRTGDPGDAGDGSQVNNFFSQNGVGAIRRGNWLGLGLNAIF